MNVPFLHSIRMRIVLLVVIPMLFCILTISIMANTSIRANDEIRSAFSSQADLYQSLSLYNTLCSRLEDYLSTTDADYLQEYREVAEEFSLFTQQLEKGPIYSRSMAVLNRKLLLAAAGAMDHIDDEIQLVEGYREAAKIRGLISSLSPYTAKEIQETVSDDVDRVTSGVSRTLRNNIVFLAAILLILILVAVLIAGSFIQPLTVLTKAAGSMSISDRSTALADTGRKDELGILMRTFQDMVRRIHTQLEELEDKQKIEQMLQQEKEKTLETENQLVRSELNVYQSQINSHFLFNAFNTVSRLAYLENAPQVQHAVSLIAQFLRNIMTQFNRTITVEEEFSIVENYIEIQKMRFGDRIKVESSMDADTEWFSIPALTIQPLVENAYRHGLSDHKEGYIRYAAETEEDGILLYVWDDGQGISPDRQEKIRRYLTEKLGDTSSDDCLGLRNVYQRLLLMYPDHVEFYLESVENAYTQIGFKIRKAL